MSLYSVALFVHIVGALALFALLAIEGVLLRGGASPTRVQQVLGPISAVAIVVPGFYMAFAGAGWHAWAEVGLVSYIVIAVAGAYTGISVTRGRMSAGAVMISWLARIGIALGVVFDMTVKPDAVVSVAAVAAGVVAAVAAGLASRRTRAA
ncbi:MAG TPA: hypothetical protein VFL27_12275 [Candidatus Dormibacteraeota bacterium]|nr:hypothetical protein [Candidatus Dormibacteraeota bacterium]